MLPRNRNQNVTRVPEQPPFEIPGSVVEHNNNKKPNQSSLNRQAQLGQVVALRISQLGEPSPKQREARSWARQAGGCCATMPVTRGNATSRAAATVDGVLFNPDLVGNICALTDPRDFSLAAATCRGFNSAAHSIPESAWKILCDSESPLLSQLYYFKNMGANSSWRALLRQRLLAYRMLESEAWLNTGDREYRVPCDSDMWPQKLGHPLAVFVLPLPASLGQIMVGVEVAGLIDGQSELLFHAMEPVCRDGRDASDGLLLAEVPFIGQQAVTVTGPLRLHVFLLRCSDMKIFPMVEALEDKSHCDGWGWLWDTANTRLNVFMQHAEEPPEMDDLEEPDFERVVDLEGVEVLIYPMDQEYYSIAGYQSESVEELLCALQMEAFAPAWV